MRGLALPAQVADLGEISEAHRALYKERNGKYELDVDGMVPSSALDGMREAYGKRLADALEKVQGISSGIGKDEMRELVKDTVAGLVKPNGGGEGGGSDPLLHDLERRMAAMEKDLSKANEEKTQAQTALRSFQMKTQLQSAATRAGVRPEAVDNLTSVIQDQFELGSDGVAHTKAGCSFGIDLDPQGFFDKIKADPGYSYFWPSSVPGGADAGGGGNAGGSPNPWTKAGWNLTEQARLIRSDEAKAKRLAEAAGSSFGAVNPPE